MRPRASTFRGRGGKKQRQNVVSWKPCSGLLCIVRPEERERLQGVRWGAFMHPDRHCSEMGEQNNSTPKEHLRILQGKEIGPETLATYLSKESSSDSAGGGYSFQFLKTQNKNSLPILELLSLP